MNDNTSTDEIWGTLWNAPMSRRGWFSTTNHDNPGTVNFFGLDHGLTTVLHWRNTPGLGTVVTFHEAGSKHWTGRGMKAAYTGARTFTVVARKADANGRFAYILLGEASLPVNAEARVNVTAQFKEWAKTIN
jgi:hypothetical protein